MSKEKMENSFVVLTKSGEICEDDRRAYFIPSVRESTEEEREKVVARVIADIKERFQNRRD